MVGDDIRIVDDPETLTSVIVEESDKVAAEVVAVLVTDPV